MKVVTLPGTGRTTSVLGFGCSSLMGGMNRTESLRTLGWAYDAGIRHFDVAPAYGYGAAEACLGEFLARHAGELTVTTKFGIPPAQNPGMMQLARNLARPILRALPALKKRAQAAASAVAAVPTQRDLSVAAAKQSLEKSLRDLRVERIDLFLLHDATLAEVQDSPLVAFLEEAQHAGHIGAFGVGTDRDHAAAILAKAPAYAPVVQREWSVFEPADLESCFHIHHRSLADSRRGLAAYLSGTPRVAEAWSAEVDADLRDDAVLSTLMMRAALRSTTGGIVLFSSKDKAHIQHNASLTAASADDARADALHRVVQRDGVAGATA